MIRQRQRIALLGALSGTIPFAQLLDAGYRPWALETVATTLAFVSAGMIGGLLSARRTPIYAALFTLAFYFFADANLVSGATQLILLAIACTAVFLAFQKREEWLPTAVTAFAVMFSMFAAIQAIMAAGPAWEPANWRTPSTTTGSKPSVLHIVLDEMTTPALASNTPAPGHPASMILDDLAARGFEVHDRADSNSFNTYKSVGAVVGMTNSDDNFIKLRGGPFSFEARQNGLLTKFKDAGYQVRAVQFGYLDICKGNPEFTCQTYPRGFEMNV
ncbi:MAG: hypothetical protein MUE79_02640, partial [Nitratireductor sp.]|nr:hypothetical protein [Nitratireductor sp.]